MVGGVWVGGGGVHPLSYPMPNETQWFDQVGKHKIEIWVCDLFVLFY